MYFGNYTAASFLMEFEMQQFGSHFPYIIPKRTLSS